MTAHGLQKADGLLNLIVLVTVFAASVRAAEPTTSPANLTPPVKLTADQDHQRMMNMLHLKSPLPPGASGQHPNYDESIANPYPNLPDPLVLKNGEKVTTAKMWWNQRRPEILEDFDREIYGRRPAHIPSVTWQVADTKNNGTTITKQLVGHVDNSAYPLITVDIKLTLVTPAAATAPVPVIMQFGPDPAFFARFLRRSATSTAATRPAVPASPNWQQQILSLGWGYAMLNTSFQADNGAGLTAGIIGLVNKGQPRPTLDDWGVLSAWAWGGSRALDYFETDKSVDAHRIGIEGHSRWGKTTLLAMALDQRFAIAFVSSSGEAGAKLHRRNWGELVENITGSGEYHWMAGNFIKYAGHWNDLPIDSHELIALCAPRPVFITGGTALKGDGWVDARGMFLATVAAGPVYKLLGKKDLGTSEMPPLNTALIDGDLAFRYHDGGHSDAFDFPTFLTFAQRYFQ